MAKKSGAGFTKATPDKSGTAFANTGSPSKLTYSTGSTGKKGKAARKDILSWDAKNTYND